MIGIVTAVAILAAAWFVGGRQGFGSIGKGGINQHFLPKVGEVAPDLMAFDANQQPVYLSSFRGKPVWLTFWGSWCPPCRSEMPEVQAAYQQLAPEGVVLMSVSVNESYVTSWLFAQGLGATFPILNVPDRGLIAASYNVTNFPTHLFIDKDGIVRTIIAGPVDTGTAVREGEALLALNSAPGSAST